MAIKGLIMLALAALLVGATVAQPPSSGENRPDSFFTLHPHSHCKGHPTHISNGTCYFVDRDLRDGFRFNFNLEIGVAFDSPDCTGTATVFTKNVPDCTEFGSIQSLRIFYKTPNVLEVV